MRFSSCLRTIWRGWFIFESSASGETRCNLVYINLLRNNPQFARLWAAMLISFIGDWFNTIALAAIVSRFTNGSGLAISLFLLARFLPPLIVTPIAGAVADRYDRKKLLIASDLLRVVAVLCLLLVQTPDQLWLLYLLTVLQFALGSIFEPARSALTPATVRPDDLVTANVLGSLTWSLALWLGALSGGLIAGTFGISVALIVDAASFLISALLIAAITPAPAARSAERQALRLSDISDGLRYARAHPDIGATLLVKFGGSLGNVDSLLIVYATILFPLFITGLAETPEQAGAYSLGVLYTAFGIGAILGLILIERFNDGAPRTMRRLIVFGYGLITVGWVLFGSAGTLWIAAFALLIKAMGSNTYWTYSSVILQKTVDDRYLGRMFSLDYAGFQLSTVLSTIVTGLILETAGSARAPAIVLGTAVVSLIPLVVWMWIVRWIERRDERLARASQVMP
jgi:MFS family permease